VALGLALLGDAVRVRLAEHFEGSRDLGALVLQLVALGFELAALALTQALRRRDILDAFGGRECR
jgi:hypothetical protein